MTSGCPNAGRIVVDALAARFGGSAYAVIQVASRIADHPAIDELIVVTRAGSLVDRGLRDRPGLRTLRLPAAERLELPRRIAWEAVGLWRAIQRHDAGSLLTWSGMLPHGAPAPVVSYLANPVPFLERGNHTLRRFALKRTSRTATAVLVPSAAMAELAEAHLGRVPEVVPLGVDHARFTPAGTPGQDVLCVGDFYPHKRHDTAIAAWAALPAPRPRLRLIGDPRVAATHARAVAASVEAHKTLGSITVESGLTLSALLEAYRHARVLLVPSERESFCMPLLEAQACGVPAIARDSPVLRETGGRGTTFIPTDDPAEWTGALIDLLGDDRRHTAARAAGLSHAVRYGWESTAAGIGDRLVEAALSRA